MATEKFIVWRNLKKVLKRQPWESYFLGYLSASQWYTGECLATGPCRGGAGGHPRFIAISEFP